MVLRMFVLQCDRCKSAIPDDHVRRMDDESGVPTYFMDGEREFEVWVTDEGSIDPTVRTRTPVHMCRKCIKDFFVNLPPEIDSDV